MTRRAVDAVHALFPAAAHHHGRPLERLVSSSIRQPRRFHASISRPRGITNVQGRDIFVFVRLRGAARALVRSTLPLTVLLALLARGTQAQSLRPFEWVPAGGIHFMGPLRASVSGGVLGVFNEGRGEEAVLAQIEAGLGGAKIRGGLASTQAFLTGFTIEGAMLRTFGNPVGADRWRTYAGGEVHGILVLLNVGFGLYAPLGGGGRTLHTITLGLGL